MANDSSDDDYEPEYETESIRIGEDINIEVLTVVPPPLEYLASLRSNHQEISGRKIWTGSLSLANTFLNLSEYDKQAVFHQKRVLELGSGTGILGMAIARICFPNYTPLSIVLTDGDEMAITLLQRNLNNPSNNINVSSLPIHATSLDWGTPVSERFLDWCRLTLNDHESSAILFDTIIAGDVLYKKELPSLFFTTAFVLLSKNTDSSLWLCHIPRHGVLHSIVVDAAQAAGFVVTIIDTSIISHIEGCVQDDLQRAITYRMYINKN